MSGSGGNLVTSKLYDFVGVFSQGLGTLEHVLEVGVRHGSTIGASEAQVLDWRLIDDMYPLREQATTAINSSQQWAARAAGAEQPAGPAGEPGLAELKAAIGRAKTFLADLKPEAFEGRDDLVVKVSLGQIEPELPLIRWMHGFAVPNFHFHLTTAYAICRHKGAPLGKADFFAGGLGTL
jgi:hypothetical protein